MATQAAPAEYLYVPCVRGCPAGTRRWVQQVPIVRKTVKLIYYASDSWDRGEAVVSPGCISREQFETDTEYPAGVIPIPGYRPAGRLFFATREAAEADLYRGERQRAERGTAEAPAIKDLRRVMIHAHPDRGGTAEQFIQARRRYQLALRSAGRQRGAPTPTAA
jgi:hypothetical protein